MTGNRCSPGKTPPTTSGTVFSRFVNDVCNIKVLAEFEGIQRNPSPRFRAIVQQDISDEFEIFFYNRPISLPTLTNDRGP